MKSEEVKKEKPVQRKASENSSTKSIENTTLKGVLQ